MSMKRGGCCGNPNPPLAVGDLLESGDGQLRICKYVGFEPAQWVIAGTHSGLLGDSHAGTPSGRRN